MGKMNPQVDAYIAKSPDYAQPILTHLRGLVHKAVPEVEEGIKWGMPFFDYAGGPLCSMAAFKVHVAFAFWKAPVMKSAIVAGKYTAMSSIGKIGSKKELPKDSELTAAIKEAAALNEAGVKVSTRSTRTKPDAELHPAFAASLEKNKAAQKQFDAFSPSKRRDYINWVGEAKTDATRKKRIAEAVEWISEGKARNWKYEKK